jgi:hypothetical protein
VLKKRSNSKKDVSDLKGLEISCFAEISFTPPDFWSSISEH